MGQNASTPRGLEDSTDRDRPLRRLRQRSQDSRGRGQVQRTLRQNERPVSIAVQPLYSSSASQPAPYPAQTASISSQQVSARSAPVRTIERLPLGGSDQRSPLGHSHQEQQQITDIERTQTQNGTVTEITATPLPRQSRMSSFSSSVARRLSISRGFGVYRQQTSEGDNNLDGSSPNITNSRTGGLGFRLRDRNRFSITSSTASASNTLSRQISEPFADAMGTGSPLAGYEAPPNTSTQLIAESNVSAPFSESGRVAPSRITSRLNRIRQSVSIPFGSIPSLQRSSIYDDFSSRPRSTEVQPPLQPSTPPYSADDPPTSVQAGTRDASTRRLRRSQMSTASAVSNGPLDLQAGGSESVSGRLEAGGVGRRNSHGPFQAFRAQSNNRIQGDQDESLPRVLSLAALALASRFSGPLEGSPQDLQHAFGTTDLEGSLQNLFRVLQSATQRQGGADLGVRDRDQRRPVALGQSFNFLRVFRVANNTSRTENPSDPSPIENINGLFRERSADGEDGNSPEETTENRTVTLVVVGVRAVPFNEPSHEENASRNPEDHSVLGMGPRSTPPDNANQRRAATLRQMTGRSRISHRQRHSGRDSDFFQFGDDGHRHPQDMISEPFSLSGGMNATHDGDNALASAPATYAETPGPSPPPSTPADSGLSPFSSGTSTPIRRPNSASAIQNMPAIQEPTLRSTRENNASISPERFESNVRQRRRSDSEFARHRDLGAGAARRNGVVGPDEGATPAPTGATNRSWLVYVVGTNLSEDHPALSTPSLFSDNPSYEDMLLLSSLLGPAKPPVATREDVEQAKGVFVIEGGVASLVAHERHGSGILPLGAEERCLICLDGYQVAEELRKLSKCSHIFHRSCVDEWLTTGRNSCPLCRSQGVDEVSSA